MTEEGAPPGPKLDDAFLDKLILAATFNHGLKMLFSRLIQESGATFAVAFRADRVWNLLQKVAVHGEASTSPDSLALDAPEARHVLTGQPLSDRKDLFSPESACGHNIALFHPIAKYLLAVIRLEAADQPERMARAVASLRQSGRVYGAALAQADEKDRIAAEGPNRGFAARDISSLEMTLDEPEMEKVLDGVVASAMARVPAQSGCLLLAHEAEDALVLETAAYRGKLLLDPKSLPRTLKPRNPDSGSAGGERRSHPRAEGIYFHVRKSGRPYLSGDLKADRHHSPLFEGSCSCIAVPVTGPNGETLGILLLESDRPDAFSLDQASSLEELAGVARTYLLKARLYRMTSQEARPIVLIGVDRRTVESALLAARYDEPVLIRGETGSGKEMLARSIHVNSLRKNRPFEAVNCSTLAGPLAQSQLFGHVKGAFTDAREDRKGLLEVADGGVLFLDEIEKMPIETQHLLLRVIETLEFNPVGAPGRKKRVDVRLMAATNADLKQKMEEGSFLSDLYYRIGCLVLDLPPLRERKLFIPKLVERTVQKLAAKYKRAAPSISSRAMRMFRDYEYPGNVRELQNLVTQAFTQDSDGEIDFGDLPQTLFQGGRMNDTRYLPAVRSASGPMAPEMDRSRLEEALSRAQGDADSAAKAIGVSRATFYRLLKRHEIDPKRFR